MKKLTLTALATGAFFLLHTTEAAAQQTTSNSDWGSWQLVSSTRNPKSVNVQFYTTDGVLMYEERVEGRRLNTTRRKVCRQLDNALTAAYLAWKKDKAGTMGQKDLFANSSHRKRESCPYSAGQ